MATIRIDFDPPDLPTSVVLTSLRRLDTDAALTLPSPATFTDEGGGTFSRAFTEPELGLEYSWAATVTWSDASTSPMDGTIDGDTPAESRTYLSPGEAIVLATRLPPLSAAWSAATTEVKAAALEQASADVDAAGPYQGRRYDLTNAQTLEFPRVPYPSSADPLRYAAWGAGWPGWGVDQVWDWDATNNVVVVPLNVKRAVLYQADYILSGAATKTANRQQAIASGLASQSTGGLSESYRADAAASGVSGWNLLTARAQSLLRQYRLKTGKLL